MYIDFKQGYDSVDRMEVYWALQEFGIPLKIIKTIRLAMKDTKAVMKTDRDLSSNFELKKGLRQGDMLPVAGRP